MRSDVVTNEPIGLTPGFAGWHLFTADGVAAWAEAELGCFGPPVAGWHVPPDTDRPSPTVLCRVERQTLAADVTGATWWPGVPPAAAGDDGAAAAAAAADDAAEAAEAADTAEAAEAADAAETAEAADTEEGTGPAAAEDGDHAESDGAPPACRHRLQPMST